MEAYQWLEMVLLCALIIGRNITTLLDLDKSCGKIHIIWNQRQLSNLRSLSVWFVDLYVDIAILQFMKVSF